MKTLDELKSEAISLKLKLEVNAKAQNKIHQDVWEEKHGFKLGNRVSYMDGKKEISGVLTHFDFNTYDNTISRPMVTLFKKDGSLGSLVKNVWHDDLKTMKKI